MIVAILHNIRSVHNVASIFRTADGAGVSKLYLTGITPSPLDRFGKYLSDFAKVSLGAERTVSWEKVNSVARVINDVRREGYKTLAVEQSKKSIPYYTLSKSYILSSKSCLIFGNEVRGLPPLILKHADKILEIPMRGSKESLNVAVAFGIVLFRIVYPRTLR